VTKGAVAGGAGDGDVEPAVGQVAAHVVFVLLDHVVEDLFQVDQFLVGDGGGGQGAGLAFDQAASLGQLEGADVQFGCGDLDRRGLGDIDARAVARLDQAADFQRDHRLAHRGAADLVLLGQVAFRGQAMPGLEGAFADRFGDRVGDLLVELASFCGRRGHATFPPSAHRRGPSSLKHGRERRHVALAHL
jgi:hypothetical protein